MGNIETLTLEVIVIRTVLALLFGGLLGLERGIKNQAAGIRTYMLVSMGSAMVMMTSQFAIATYGTGDPVRMGAQVISGVGFLGAGTILVTEQNKIKGLTTAAGLWASACVGLAIGIGFYMGAIIMAFAMLAIMIIFAPVKKYLSLRTKLVNYHIVVDSMESFHRVLLYLNSSKMDILDIKTSAVNSSFQDKLELKIGTEMSCYISLKLRESFQHLKVIQELSGITGVLYLEQMDH